MRTGDQILETRISSGPEGTRPQVEAGRGGEGIGLSQGRRKDGTKKEATTGFERDACDVEGGKRGANRRGKRRKKRSRGTGLQGPRGTMGSKSRAARHQVQGRAVEAGGSGSFSRWTVYKTPE